MNLLEYKGYYTNVKFDNESGMFMGKIEDIGDFVNFESSRIEDAESEFHKAVDDYLEFCEEVDKTPEFPCRVSKLEKIWVNDQRQYALAGV